MLPRFRAARVRSRVSVDARRRVASLAGQSRLKQTTAQASSTNADHRPESRSHRTCRRRQQLSHDNARSTFQRWRPAGSRTRSHAVAARHGWLGRRSPSAHGICAHLAPPRLARTLMCPHRPAARPAGPARPADPGPRDAVIEHPSLGPLGEAPPAGRRRAASAVQAAGCRSTPARATNVHRHRSAAIPVLTCSNQGGRFSVSQRQPARCSPRTIPGRA